MNFAGAAKKEEGGSSTPGAKKTTPGKMRNQERNVMKIKVDPGNGSSL